MPAAPRQRVPAPPLSGRRGGGSIAPWNRPASARPPTAGRRHPARRVGRGAGMAGPDPAAASGALATLVTDGDRRSRGQLRRCGRGHRRDLPASHRSAGGRSSGGRRRTAGIGGDAGPAVRPGVVRRAGRARRLDGAPGGAGRRSRGGAAAGIGRTRRGLSQPAGASSGDRTRPVGGPVGPADRCGARPRHPRGRTLRRAGGAAAGAWFSASASRTYTITTGTWDNDAEDGDPEEPDTSSKVWGCKLVGPPGQPQLSRGENPIRVVASSTSDGRFSDGHGSPVVEEGSTARNWTSRIGSHPSTAPTRDPRDPDPPMATPRRVHPTISPPRSRPTTAPARIRPNPTMGTSITTNASTSTTTHRAQTPPWRTTSVPSSPTTRPSATGRNSVRERPLGCQQGGNAHSARVRRHPLGLSGRLRRKVGDRAATGSAIGSAIGNLCARKSGRCRRVRPGRKRPPSQTRSAIHYRR